MAGNVKEIDKKISKAQKAIEKIDKKEERDGKLSNVDAGTRSTYQKMLKELEAEKESILNGGSKPATTTRVTTTTKPATITKPAKTNVNKNTPPSSTENALTNSEQKAKETADAMNSEEEKNDKVGDAGSATQTANEMGNTVDAHIEENVPTWFWREAQEMAPTDKAKRGFIISDYIFNRLGTALGNTGAIIQNAGGSGGASLKEHGGSYIDQYRKSKLEQALSNRKKKQDNLLQQQIDALIAIGASENEARAIQNKLRNSKHLNRYNRLTNEQQVYLQALLYNDTKGEISDAVLGNLIDRIVDGKDVSLEQAAVNAFTAYGIDNADSIRAAANDISGKVLKFLNWDKVGE